MTAKTTTKQNLNTPRLKEHFNSEVADKLKKDFDLNAMQVPKLEKIVVSVGLGKDKDNKRMFEVATNTLAKITGQQPVETIAKKSIANFKLREGSRIGLKVTLRGDRMYEFLDRIVNLVLPRLRDFHGTSSGSFDQNGNYSLGLKDQSVFHELSFDEIATAHGLEISIVTTTNDVAQSRALLEGLGMPFEKKEAK